MVVEWSSRDSQPANLQVPGLQISPLGRPQFYLDRQLRAFLTERGVTHEAVETPGAHVWPVWRRNLAAFAPKLFR